MGMALNVSAEVTFDFEDSLVGITTEGKEIAPSVAENYEFVEGMQGKAIKLQDGSFLRYPTADIFNRQ